MGSNFHFYKSLIITISALSGVQTMLQLIESELFASRLLAKRLIEQVFCRHAPTLNREKLKFQEIVALIFGGSS